MAVSVTTDLTDVTNADSTTAGGTFYRLNGTSSANPAQDLDAFIQGTGCVASKMGTAVGTTNTGSHFNHTSTFDLSGGKHLYHWRQIVTAGNMQTKANQGVTLGLTNTSTTSTTAWSTTNYKQWFLDGSDTAKAAVGWKCYVIDPAGTADASAGTLTLTSVKNVGFICRQISSVTTTVSNQFVDAVRAGTGVTASATSALDTITLTNIYDTDSTPANSWGVVTQTAGIYYGAGKINIGLSGQSNACNFTDADQVLIWRNYPVSSSLYAFNIVGNGSFATTMQITGWVVRGQAGKVWDIVCGTGGVFKAYGCALSNIQSAVLSSASVVDGCSVTASGTVDLNGGIITSCDFSDHTANQILCSSPSEVNNITDSTFTKGAATAHAIEITGTAANFTLDGITFTGYAGTNGSTGNEAIFVNIGSGNVEITVLNGSNPSIRTAGAAVSFAATPVSVKVTVKDAATGDVIQNARVLLEKVSDGADILTGLTNASGVISGSFSYTADTVVTGVVRRASAGLGTLYKPNVISGTITNAGFDVTILLISDE
jgi:hypothetical protein